MAARRAGLGDSFPTLVRPGRIPHEEHLKRCIEKLPADWKPGDEYPRTMTRGDIAAWELEQFRYDVAHHLMRVIRQNGNVKAMELYYRVVGTPETRPGVGVQVNVGVATQPTRFIVEEVRPGQLHEARRLQLQAAAGGVIDAEATEVDDHDEDEPTEEEAATKEEEKQEREEEIER